MASERSKKFTSVRLSNETHNWLNKQKSTSGTTISKLLDDILLGKEIFWNSEESKWDLKEGQND